MIIKDNLKYGYFLTGFGLNGILYIFTNIIPLHIMQGLMLTMIYIIAGLGVGLLLFLTGLINFSTSIFIGIGSYITAHILKKFIIPYSILIILIIGCAIILGIVIGFLSLRVSGTQLLIITMSLSIMISIISALPNPISGGPNGLYNIPYAKLFCFIPLNRNLLYFIILLVLYILIIIDNNIIYGPIGRSLRAIKTNEKMAASMGINIVKYKILIFVIATIHSMLAGMLYINFMQSTVYTTWSINLSMNILLAVCLGGTVKPIGVILGTFFIFGLDYIVLQNIPIFQNNSQFSLLFSAILIIIILLKFPGGLYHIYYNIKSHLRKEGKK